MELSGAEILIASLEKEGVEVIFGYPGGAVLGIYDVLFSSKIRHVLTRHEQGAAHAADGYARATGKPGVCLATSGPGATNLVTGIATAYMDSVPLIALTGQVGTSFLGRDSFQEADITGITLPITKHNFLVKDVKNLARTIKEAFYIATTGRPGPVLIDLPKDVTGLKTEFRYPQKVEIAGYKPIYAGHIKQITEAAEAIEKAQRPVIYAGGGVILSDAHEELRELAEKANIPVTCTLMGLGGFPGTHSLSLGMLGMHGTVVANYAIQSSDLIVTIGARFDDRVTGRTDTFGPNAKIIHIDIDPAEIGKNVCADIPIVGDAKQVLKVLNHHVKFKERRGWIEKIEEWKRDFALSYGGQGSDVIKPQYVVEQIHELTKGDAIIVTEVGQNQMWAAQYYKFNTPRSFLSSGGLGTMGYGFPAAIGAQVARPDKVVFNIAGDGSIQMNIQELATAVAEKLPVKVAILNNQYLGMVRQWQELFYERRYSYVNMQSAPDFVKVAEAYGAVGLRATKPEEVRSVLEEAMKVNDRPVFIDFRVSREENVFPMVPANGVLDKMILGVEE